MLFHKIWDKWFVLQKSCCQFAHFLCTDYKSWHEFLLTWVNSSGSDHKFGIRTLDTFYKQIVLHLKKDEVGSGQAVFKVSNLKTSSFTCLHVWLFSYADKWLLDSMLHSFSSDLDSLVCFLALYFTSGYILKVVWNVSCSNPDISIIARNWGPV